MISYNTDSKGSLKPSAASIPTYCFQVDFTPRHVIVLSSVRMQPEEIAAILGERNDKHDVSEG
jgi:hypothetical protein